MTLEPGSWSPKGIDDLEAAAWSALRASASSVIAGPGAGKTEFLAQKAAYLLETGICLPPQQILAISFKRDAAVNLQRRVEARLPDHLGRFQSMTFDAFTKSLVDRFKQFLPVEWRLTAYEIGFSSKSEVETFLREATSSAPSGLKGDIHAFSASTFVADHVGVFDLAQFLSGDPPSTAEEYLVREWWVRNYLRPREPKLDFVMLNRLALLIVESSPQLQRALRVTYPYVFVDEFQDTTYAQYSFLASVFGDKGVAVTVVGDRNQRIMGWAGALDDAFSQFEHDFAADRFNLISNFRSNQQLVDLQHRFVRRLDPHAQLQQAKRVQAAGASPIEVWSFKTAKREAEAIAAWIASDIEEFGSQPSDFALIARQRVADLAPVLRRALGGVGLALRNDDALIGTLRLIDLLKHDLVRLFVGVVRLAAKRGGHPQTWEMVVGLLGRLVAPSRVREVGTQVEDDLAEFLHQLRSWFAQTPIDSLSGSSARKKVARSLTEQLCALTAVDAAASRRVFGDRREDVRAVVEAFEIRATEVLDGLDSWDRFADAFSDEDAVPLLTVHRSKGLEYQTVFFIGLEESQWWSHARETIESTMTFFVGVSRAAERLFFTQCDERGTPAPLGALYEDLEAAGVPRVPFD